MILSLKKYSLEKSLEIGIELKCFAHFHPAHDVKTRFSKRFFHNVVTTPFEQRRSTSYVCC